MELGSGVVHLVQLRVASVGRVRPRDGLVHAHTQAAHLVRIRVRVRDRVRARVRVSLTLTLTLTLALTHGVAEVERARRRLGAHT